MIGFTSVEAVNTLRLVDKFDMLQYYTIESLTPDEISNQLGAHSRHTFDLIVVNQEVLNFDFEHLKHIVMECLPSLQTHTGMLVVNHMLAPRYFIDDDIVDVNKVTDAWKLLADVRQHEYFDAALANFDNGLLIFCLRTNPYVQNAQYFLDRSESILKQFLDRIIPILTLSEVHKWLSNSTGTTRYVRRFKVT
jgi:hypothetical protein